MGLSFEKILLLAVVAAFILGPANLPRYAGMLGAGVRRLKEFVSSSKERLSSEEREAFGDIDWKKLDPRQYDPRRIIADALRDDPQAKPAITPAATATATAPSASALARAERERNLRPAPFDAQAT